MSAPNPDGSLTHNEAERAAELWRPAPPRACANDCGAMADPDRLDPFCSDECRAEEEERRRWDRIEQRRAERRG